MAVTRAAADNPLIHKMALRLTKAGKPFKVMMSACLRKLLTMLNTMVRNDEMLRSKCRSEKADELLQPT